MDITFLFVSEWIIRIFALVYLTRKRSPDAAIAWLVIIFFEPWIGFGIYLLFGSRVPSEKRLRPYRQLAELLKENVSRIVPGIEAYLADLPKRERMLAHLVREMGSFPALSGNNIELYSRSEEFIEQLVQDIDVARHHVHLEFYIYRDDEVGLAVLNALERAVDRGVNCRLLVDAVGSRQFFRKYVHHARNVGIELIDAAPVISLRRYLGRIDWRNHRKIVVIDGCVAYSGSQNIAHPSYGHKDLWWSDLMVRLTGPAVLELQAVFIADWGLESGTNLISAEMFPEQKTEGTDCVQILPSGPVYPTENYQRLVVSALFAAKRTITITTPYFIPDQVFLQAVQLACLRGVEINILVPMKTDHAIADKASQSYYHDLLEWGVNIYRYTKGVLHPKTMTVDDNISFFGSSNFDIRSFVLDFEINMVFYGRHESFMIRKQQEHYLKDSLLLQNQEWKERKKYLPLVENIAKLFSPLL